MATQSRVPRVGFSGALGAQPFKRLVVGDEHDGPLARVTAVYSKLRVSIAPCERCATTITVGHSEPWLLWTVVLHASCRLNRR